MQSERWRARINAEKSALIVVDVQNDFFHEHGAVAQMGLSIEPVQQIMPSIHRAIALARSAGVPRIFLRGEHNHWFNTDPWLERGFAGTTVDAQTVPIVETGSWGANFYQIDPTPEDLVITKHRYSGFAYTPLEIALQTMRCETVVLIGAATNVCVEATARDAVMKGYRPVIVSDCVASSVPRLHKAALEDMREYLGPVITLQDLINAWTPLDEAAERSNHQTLHSE
jgi:ureidoacrylate peracid hydrolase